MDEEVVSYVNLTVIARGKLNVMEGLHERNVTKRA